EELKRAVDARDEFLSIASHELRTPLNALMLHLEGVAVACDAPGMLDERTRHRIASAIRQTHRLDRLIESLLDVGGISTGRLQLEVEEVNLAEAVRASVERCSEPAAQAGSEIELSCPALVRGHWDRLRIEQVLNNLISNAVKYGRGKPIRVSLEDAG